MPRIHRLARTALCLGAVGALTAGCFGGAVQPAAQAPVKRHHPKASATVAPSAGPSAVSSTEPATSTPTPSGTPTAVATSPDVIAPSSPAISPSSGTAPRLVRYGATGVTVRTAADAAKLHGTSQAFRRFIVATVPQTPSGCSQGGSVTVQAWRADGFAVGDVFACGGYRAIWGTDGGTSWRELIGAQDLWSCSDLRRYRVPTSIAGDKCVANGQVEDYRQS
jgi:hypothetical protein